MSREQIRTFKLFWVLCASIVCLVLTNAYADGTAKQMPNGSNVYDVMMSGKDIGIIALVLLAFMGSIVKINSMNNKSVQSLAKSIDTMKDAQIAANMVSANNVHNMLQTLAGKPCLFDEALKESLMRSMRSVNSTVTTTVHTEGTTQQGVQA